MNIIFVLNLFLAFIFCYFIYKVFSLSKLVLILLLLIAFITVLCSNYVKRIMFCNTEKGSPKDNKRSKNDLIDKNKTEGKKAKVVKKRKSVFFEDEVITKHAPSKFEKINSNKNKKDASNITENDVFFNNFLNAYDEIKLCQPQSNYSNALNKLKNTNLTGQKISSVHDKLIRQM